VNMMNGQMVAVMIAVGVMVAVALIVAARSGG